MNINTRSLLIDALIISVVISFLHSFFGIKMALYWSTGWMDLIMHTLGGFLVGVGSLYFIFHTTWVKHLPKFITPNEVAVFTVIISSVFIVGVSWEFWELYNGLTNPVTDRLDTISDVIMDLTGGVLAYFYTKNKIWKKRK